MQFSCDDGYAGMADSHTRRIVDPRNRGVSLPRFRGHPDPCNSVLMNEVSRTPTESSKPSRTRCSGRHCRELKIYALDNGILNVLGR
jgi:hypothetical protein